MTGTFEGLGLPLYGGYVAKDSDQSATTLTVSDDGTYDHTVTLATADDILKVSLTADTAASTGYFNGILVDITNTAAFTGSSELNGVWVDMTVGANCSNTATGMGSYIMGGHASAQLFGARFAIAPSTTSLSHIGVAIEKYNTTEAAGLDTFLRLFCSGASRTNSCFWIGGGTYLPDYLIQLPTDVAKQMYGKGSITITTTSGYFKIYADTTEYRIPFFAAT